MSLQLSTTLQRTVRDSIRGKIDTTFPNYWRCYAAGRIIRSNFSTSTPPPSSATNDRNKERKRRVVITGMGAITPLGNTLTDSWNDLYKSTSGITTLQEALKWQDLTTEQYEFEHENSFHLPCQIAAPVKWNSSVEDNNKLYNARTTPRFVQFALKAAIEAMEQAKLFPWLGLSLENVLLGSEKDNDIKYEERKNRIGVSIGSGMSSVREIMNSTRVLYDNNKTGSIRKLSPYFVPKVLTNSPSGRVSLTFGLKGPNISPSTACAASSHSIGDAYQLIQNNKADIMLAGGTESTIDILSIAGFCRLRALSTTNKNDDDINYKMASRPFHKDRNGFVMGEGSTVLILEQLEHALQRGLTNNEIYGEIVGYGLTGDAYHITSPDPNGSGAERAMRMALTEASDYEDDNTNNNGDKIIDTINDVGYINAHATSTPIGDETEVRAINRIFSTSSSSTTKVSSTKGATGHLLGAAGAIEAAFTILSLHENKIPPTYNLNTVDDIDGECQFDCDNSNIQHVLSTTTTNDNSDDATKNFNSAISNSLGFGGTNSTLIFKRFNQ